MMQRENKASSVTVYHELVDAMSLKVNGIHSCTEMWGLSCEVALACWLGQN